jgi:transcriptional regulator with XRE-family HTH domain
MPRSPSPPLDSLPNRVREWRLKRGFTLKALAADARLAFAHLSKIELGQRELTQEAMDRLALALGCLPADLLATDRGGLTEQERYLVETYRQVPAAGRAAINAVAESQQAWRGAPEVVDLVPRTATA